MKSTSEDLNDDQLLNALYQGISDVGRAFIDPKSPWHSVAILEKQLGLKDGFVNGLLHEKDDWAFVIKLSVIVEATLAKVINSYLQNPKIEKHVRSLPMGGRTGKIQLARDLGVVGPKSMDRLQAIAELRNDFAHSIGVVQISFIEYFGRLRDALNNSPASMPASR